MVSKNRKRAKKWYAAGLHFECTGCGACCSGPEEGYVWIKKKEVEMLADFLGITPQQVHEKYLRRIVVRHSLVENPTTKDCIFLKENGGKKHCEIYEVRPNQCRTWPFWSSNLLSPAMWNSAGVTCPGINRGRLYTFEEIEKLRKQEKWWGKSNE